MPVWAALVDNGDGTWTYSPATNDDTSVSFSYTITDGVDTTAGTASLDITPVNDAPVNSIPGSQVTNEDTPLVFSVGTGNSITISDVDAGANPVVVALTATNGSLTLGGATGLTFGIGTGVSDPVLTFIGTIADINNALEGLQFAPDANFSGLASIRITVDDGGNVGAGVALVDLDTISITVVPVNDAPESNADSFDMNQDATLTMTASGILANDVDLDGDLLTVSLVSGPGNGTVALAADGSFVYTPNAGFSGVDTFVYVLSDGTDSSGLATVSVTVHPDVAPPPTDPSLLDRDDDPSDEDEKESDDDEPLRIVDVPSSPTTPQPNTSPQHHQARQTSPPPSTSSSLFGPLEVAEDPSELVMSTSYTSALNISHLHRSSNVFRHAVSNIVSFPTIPVFETAIVFSDLDSLVHDLENHEYFFELVAGSTMMATGAVSAGFVLWAARASYFVTMLSTSLPAWAVVDPIPVLDAHALDKLAAKRDNGKNEQSLADLADEESASQASDRA